jgi:polyhydroxybutyrate depolymerase
MQIHGDADPTVAYNGSVNPLGSSLSVDSVLNYWIAHNNCDQTPIITAVPDVNSLDGSTAERYDYLNGDSGAEVVHYKITGGEHTWPGAFAQSGKVTNQDFDASTEIWKFFSKYEKSSLVSVDEFVKGSEWIELRSENPSLGMLKLASLNMNPYSISIINIEGKVLLTQNNNVGESTINLGSLSNGNYLVKVIDNQQAAIIKIIKQ